MEQQTNDAQSAAQAPAAPDAPVTPPPKSPPLSGQHRPGMVALYVRIAEDSGGGELSIEQQKEDCRKLAARFRREQATETGE